MKKVAALVLLSVLLHYAPANAMDWYVPLDCPTVQDGIDCAGPGDTVVVTCGTYYEYDIVMKSGVWLRSETRAPDCVIIDAQHLGRVFECSGVDSTSGILGVTVTGGDAFPGGGLYAFDSSINIVDCTFLNNVAIDSSGVQFIGGGAMCLDTGTPTVTGCTFNGNSAWSVMGSPFFIFGGGVYCNSAAVFTDCAFSNNDAVYVPMSKSGIGGGIYCDGPAVLIDCTFDGNTAGVGGGMASGTYLAAGAPTLVNCTFANHSFANNGGAIHAGDSLSLAGCDFDNNSADWGAAIYLTDDATLIADSCTFSGGAAANGGGAIYASQNSRVTTTGCIFAGNIAGSGGAIYLNPVCSTTLINCTLAENEATNGGGIFCAGFDTLTVENTIIAFGGVGRAITDNIAGTTELSCCDLYGNAGGDWVGDIAGQLGFDGNISEYPFFCGLVDPLQPYALADISPCAPSANPSCGLIGALGVSCVLVVAPAIVSIDDVGNDQGGYVRVRFTRSTQDTLDSNLSVTQYEVYRRRDPASAGWDSLGAIPAHGTSEYSIVTSTLEDSTAGGIYWSVFFIKVRTENSLIFVDSAPDSGYSVDNLSPNVPQGFAVAYNADAGNRLTWDPCLDVGFQCYRIYRGSAPGFAVSEETRVHSTAEAIWVDTVTNGTQYFYKITAVDHSGNESDPASPENVTGIDGRRAPTRFALYRNVPNPFNPTTSIAFDVPAGGGMMTLEVFDVQGRRVATLVEGMQAPGRRTATWDGTNSFGQKVASGVYFYRLVAPAYEKTMKMTLVQ